MTAPVDVRAVLDRMVRSVGARTDKNRDADLAAAHEARAAVAELIEAASRAAIASVRGDETRPGSIRNTDLDALRAAVARVGGAA